MSADSPAPIRLLLVDDHRIVLEGLRVLLAPLAHVTVVGSATTAAEARQLARHTRPDVVLLDLNLPDGSGIDVCQQLLAEQPALRVVALTTLNKRSYLTRMIQAGAAGYVLKNALPEELAEALARVCAGNTFFSEEMQLLLLQAEDPANPAAPSLTRREKEILGCIAEGLTSQQMADKLFISYLTIETHRRNLLTKFRVHNTITLVNQATLHGLI